MMDAMIWKKQKASRWKDSQSVARTTHRAILVCEGFFTTQMIPVTVTFDFAMWPFSWSMMFFPVRSLDPVFPLHWPGFATITRFLQNVWTAWVTPHSVLHYLCYIVLYVCYIVAWVTPHLWNQHSSQSLCELTLTHSNLLPSRWLRFRICILLLVFTLRLFHSKLTCACFRSTSRRDTHICICICILLLVFKADLRVFAVSEVNSRTGHPHSGRNACAPWEMINGRSRVQQMSQTNLDLFDNSLRCEARLKIKVVKNFFFLRTLLLKDCLFGRWSK